MTQSCKKCIVLVEDDPNDVFFLQLAFKQAGITVPLHVLDDGRKAIDYLEGNGPYADRNLFPWPDLILLDLNLPLVPGLEVLATIRSRRECASLLVVVLTSSQSQRDIQECQRLGARSYLVKPISTADRLQLAKSIKEYWLELNVAPLLYPPAAIRPQLPRL